MKIKHGRSYLLAAVILCLFLSGCRKEVIPEDTISFLAIEEGMTEATEEAMSLAPVTYAEGPEESMTVPTISEQPYTPEIELVSFNNFGLISDTVTVGNLRNAASTNGLIVGRFYPNTGMEILEDMGTGWYRVSSGGIEGFVSATLVLTGDAARAQAMRYENVWVRITASSLNVRMEPSLDSGILARVTAGQTYRVVGQYNDWYKVTIGTEEGYVSRDYAILGYTVAQAENWNQIANLSGKALVVAQWGMQYLGLRYILGGENMSTGVDCSYFAGMCMAQAGVKLPRTSREQAQVGTQVALGDRQPGDLLFYATHGYIDHVAIYIGDNKILHAAQSVGCVSISAYNYCGEPVMVRRYF
ncbi:MAG: C40 family peptidase [Lachnospiraceae bacterium]|nr:C40 family peptidase [Lachnospiraceae bacterium]